MPPGTPRFSVIVPTCDRAALLERTLASVRAQRFADFETIVVDAGSADSTAELLARLAPHVTSHRVDRAGPGTSRNAGAARARGDYLAFLDSDDLWFPWSLEVYAALIERHGAPALLAGNYMQFANEAELSGVSESPAGGRWFRDYLASWSDHRVVGAGMTVVRRDAFLACGGFALDADNLEDHDLALRLGEAAGFVQVDTVTLAWRRHEAATSRQMPRNIEGCWRLLRTERAGGYPGGNARAIERRHIITSHLRSTSIECARAGHRVEAWRLYWATLGWHAALGRWKYVLSFPPYLAVAAAVGLGSTPSPER